MPIGVNPVRTSIAVVAKHAARLAGVVALTLVFAACSSGLSSAAWLWCKENLPAVDTAAAALEIPTSQIDYQEPSWWGVYVNSTLNFNNAELISNADFIGSCDSAADKAGVAESRISWCETDGVGNAWDAAVSLGLMVDLNAETYAYKAKPLDDRLNDPDFMRACQQAYDTRTN
jgi:hypothetical protein